MWAVYGSVVDRVSSLQKERAKAALEDPEHVHGEIYRGWCGMLRLDETVEMPLALVSEKSLSGTALRVLLIGLSGAQPEWTVAELDEIVPAHLVNVRNAANSLVDAGYAHQIAVMRDGRPLRAYVFAATKQASAAARD